MKKQLTTDNAPKADHILSQAIETNGFVYVSGQIHATTGGEIVHGSVSEKLKQIFDNIRNILTAAGLSLNNVVKVTVYVTDMSYMPELNAAYPEYFKQPFPAREAVCVSELPLGATIEISVIAAREH